MLYYNKKTACPSECSPGLIVVTHTYFKIQSTPGCRSQESGMEKTRIRYTFYRTTHPPTIDLFISNDVAILAAPIAARDILSILKSFM